MNKRKKLLLMMGGKKLVPYSVDFSTLADGSLPSRFTGATWSIISGAAVNSPVLGDEIAGNVGNGDFETGDPPTGWVASNATLSASGDVHAGLQALSVVATAANGFGYKNFTVNKDIWYAESIWVKKITGQADVLNSFGVFDEAARFVYHVTPAEYTSYIASALTSGTSLTIVTRQVENGNTCLFDDLSIKPLVTSQLITSVNAGTANVIVKANIDITSSKAVGVICNLDSASNPKNYVIAWHNAHSIALYRCINGVYTKNIGASSSYVPGALIEIRKLGDDVYQLWYNNLQVGTDQTITNVAINDNMLHGMFATGNSKINSFYVLMA